MWKKRQKNKENISILYLAALSVSWYTTKVPRLGNVVQIGLVYMYDNIRWRAEK